MEMRTGRIACPHSLSAAILKRHPPRGRDVASPIGNAHLFPSAEAPADFPPVVNADRLVAAREAAHFRRPHRAVAANPLHRHFAGITRSDVGGEIETVRTTSAPVRAILNVDDESLHDRSGEQRRGEEQHDSSNDNAAHRILLKFARPPTRVFADFTRGECCNVYLRAAMIAAAVSLAVWQGFAPPVHYPT